MQVSSTLRYAKISAFKVREVTRAIQGLPVSAALDLVGMGLHLHIGFNLADAGSLGDARAFDLDRAHTTDRHRGEPWVVAEHRDIDPQRAGRVPDGRTCGHGDRATVDG